MIKKIGISTPVFDVNGAKAIPVTSDSLISTDSGSRRVTRTATLDGGCAVYDTGFAACDATIFIESNRSDKTIGDWFAYIVKNYNSVDVSTPRGFFYATPEKWEIRNGLPTLTLMITEQIA